MLLHANATKAAGIVGIAVLVAGGTAGVTAPEPSAIASDVLLTAGLADIDLGGGTALILGPGKYPVPGDTYLSTIDRLYLEPMGFTGNTVQVPYPFINWFLLWDGRVSSYAANLVAAVEAQLASGNVSAENPLVIVGYSETAVVAGQAMQQLHDAGIPSDYLHFVLLGDSASAHGGILSNLLPTLPEWLREPVEQIMGWVGLGDLLGVTTPTDLYPTEVFTLTGDAWSVWPQDPFSDLSEFADTLFGMFITHLEYLGLTPEQIAGVGADPALTDGLTHYWTIPDTGINPLEALWNAAMSVIPGDLSFWFEPS